MARLSIIAGPRQGEECELPRAGVLIGYWKEKLEDAARRRAELGLPTEGEPLLLEVQDPEHSISGLHCWVGTDAAGRAVVRDLGSLNGTYVGAGKERVTESRVESGQVVRLGRSGALRFRVEQEAVVECRLTRPDGDEPSADRPPARDESGGVAGGAGRVSERRPEFSRLASRRFGERALGDRKQDRVIHLDRDRLSIGRATDNDLVVNYPQVSRHHCRIERRGSGTFIRDLGSMNGTFVNGRRVTEALLARGDTIGLGSYALAFEEERLRHPAEPGQVKLEAADIRKEVPSTVIIQNISFVSCPGEFTGLIGPSGSGKTTLLNVITGYDSSATGLVRFGGVDLYANYDALRGNIGYVPQDDIIHRSLTVEQSLYYTAKLRLPEDTSDAEVKQRVDEVISDLRLDGCRNVRIGDPQKRGISGGQRKRVNLAQELITEPACLFLDEPLSGLDPATAEEVTEVLAEAARGGRSVILTTHNVESRSTFDTLDMVLLVDEGRLVYHGPGREVFDHFGGIGRDDPRKLLFYLGGKYCPKCDRKFPTAPRPLPKCDKCGEPIYRPGEYWERKFRESRYYADYVAGRMEVKSVKTGVGAKTGRQPTNGLRQWGILVRRYWRMKLSDTAGTAVLLAQAPIIALLIGLVFGDKGYEAMGGVLFMLALAAIWFGATNSCREIVAEWSVYRRERMVNLKIAPYILSKAFVLAVFLFVQCLVLSVIVKLMVAELPGSILGYTAVLTLGGIAGSAMGLLISALLSSPEGAMGLVPLTLIPQVLFAGMVVPLPQLGPMRFFSNLMISRWVLDVLSRFSTRTVGQLTPALAMTRDGANTFYWFKEMPTLGLVPGLLVLSFLTAVFTILAALALRRRDIV
ncbi:MAG: FHA domain-containing protein [bacterium]